MVQVGEIEQNPTYVITTAELKDGEVIFGKTLASPGWQLCPKCDGAGRITAGPGSSTVFEPCPVCMGKMIINIQTGLPPLYETQSAL